MTNRVVITGMGGVSSIGMSVPEIYNSLREGRPGIGQLEFPDITRLKVKTGGQRRQPDGVPIIVCLPLDTFVEIVETKVGNKFYDDPFWSQLP